MFPFEALGSLVGLGNGASAVTGQGLLWEQLKPWLAKIAQNGALKWLPQAAAQMPCQVPHYDGGQPVGSCQRVAVDQCIACRRPACLEHSFVDSNGDLICYLCVSKVAQPKQRPQPTPDRRAEALKKSWWARGVLGVDESASWDDVRKAHRALSAKFHPDRDGGDEKRYKDVQIAYDLLKTIYGES
jgi:hypothetical protein